MGKRYNLVENGNFVNYAKMNVVLVLLSVTSVEIVLLLLCISTFRGWECRWQCWGWFCAALQARRRTTPDNFHITIIAFFLVYGFGPVLVFVFVLVFIFVFDSRSEEGPLQTTSISPLLPFSLSLRQCWFILSWSQSRVENRASDTLFPPAFPIFDTLSYKNLEEAL